MPLIITALSTLGSMLNTAYIEHGVNGIEMTFII
jgi:hypothetical protein